MNCCSYWVRFNCVLNLLRFRLVVWAMLYSKPRGGRLNIRHEFADKNGTFFRLKKDTIFYPKTHHRNHIKNLRQIALEIVGFLQRNWHWFLPRINAYKYLKNLCLFGALFRQLFRGRKGRNIWGGFWGGEKRHDTQQVAFHIFELRIVKLLTKMNSRLDENALPSSRALLLTTLQTPGEAAIDCLT